MTKLLAFLLLVFNISTLSTFNIDVDNPIIYLDQTKYLSANISKKSSYFGLSVILYPGDNIHAPWIQIGAPRGNMPNSQYTNPGIIFRCEIGDKCEYLQVDNESGRVGTKYGDYYNKLDDAWIGASMDINVSANRSVVCAPRWINIYRFGLSHQDYRMLGACYWSHLNSRKFYKKLPLLDNFNDVYTDERTQESVYNYGQGEAGFSAHLTNENELLLGAPGVFNWKGSTVLYTDKYIDDNYPIASRYSVNSQKKEVELSDTEIFHDANVAISRSITQTLAFGYFGYSVTSGYFFSKMTLYYVSGAPRSKNYKGQVMIYDFLKTGNLDVKGTREGTQFGEYFGASIAAGDINGDGLDDLFVGAPFHKTSKYNEGRMYLYMGNKKGTLQEPVDGKFIDGLQVNGQFGTAITYLGTMNNDPYDRFKPKYVAVSAPYEEVSGVIYIFKGKTYGLDPVPVQRIVGSSIFPSIRGFGISISKPADIDGNGYDDIAIGAYKSGNVALLRSKPFVRIRTYFDQAPSAISSDINEFNVTICHQFYSYKGSASIQISRKILVEEDFNRAILKPGNPETKNLTIFNSLPTCENVTIKRRDSWPNAYDPLTIRVTHNLIPVKSIAERLIIGNKAIGNDHFCQRCGVYDESRSTQSVTHKVPFVLGCGNDNICVSKIHFQPKFKGIGVRNNTFILGATNVIELETTFENKGENAFLLRIQVDLPKGLNFKQTPTLCEQNQTRINCPVANPLKNNEKKTYSLKLDMDYVNRRILEDYLFINVTVLTNSINENLSFRTITLELKTEADISITGKSGEQSYSYGNDSKEGVEFEQIFQIGKYGLSPVSSIGFKILLPYAINVNSEVVNFLSLYQPEGYLEGGQSLIFKSDIPYLEENKFVSSDGIDVVEKSTEMRKRREIPSDFKLTFEKIQEEPVDSELLGNKTYEITCDDANFLCATISGKAGPFDSSKKSAVLQVRMRLNTTALSDVLKKNTLIRYTTYGLVNIEDPPNLNQTGKRPDMVAVSSLFANDVKKTIDLWIIIVSIVLGLLLLLLLTFGLTKAGFFKRTKKEELEHLKAQTDGGDIGKIDDDGVTDTFSGSM